MSDLDIKIIYKWKTGSEKPEWTEIFPDTLGVKCYYHLWDTLHLRDKYYIEYGKM